MTLVRNWGSGATQFSWAMHAALAWRARSTTIVVDDLRTPPMTARATRDPKKIRQFLERERVELLALSEAAADERRPVALDQQSVGRVSRMDAMQVQAMAQTVEARRRARLPLIDAALRRLDTGDYGYCIDCGERIPAKRLAIDPTIARCVDCAG